MSYIERPWAKIDDAEACMITYQVLKALEYLHRQGICHRDLKPENILMSTPAPGARVILADFGHSIKLRGDNQARSKRMKTTTVGTDEYVAPEIRGNKQNPRGYTIATDMWSLGIISALLLTGESVFQNSQDEYASPAAVLDAAAVCDLAKIVHSHLWQSVSNSAKEFIRNLLILDEKSRLNVEQAMKHDWFTDCQGRENVQRQYEDLIRGWMPSRPLLDFKEDLTLFREANKSTLDSILMPPPATSRSETIVSQSFPRVDIRHGSSPFFPPPIKDVVATRIAVQAAKKRKAESDDEANKPSILRDQVISTTQRESNDSRRNNSVGCEAKKPAKSSPKRVDAWKHGNPNCSYVELGLGLGRQGSSVDLDDEESRLYDRVSREEANMFRSAKSYRQSVEERRRLAQLGS